MPMMDIIKSFLSDISGHPGYIALINQIKGEMPSVPSYDVKNDNTEQWKYDSAVREGYLLCLAHLKVREND